MLEVVSFNSTKCGKRYWNCKCDCGNLLIRNTSQFNNTHGIQSCGCYNSQGIKFDLTGKKIGKLTVVRKIGKSTDSNQKSVKYLCVCDCGKQIEVLSKRLLHDKKNCGCISMKNKFKCLPYGEASFNKLYTSYKSNALQKNLEFSLSKDDTKQLFKQDCFYCGNYPIKTVSYKNCNGKFVYNGIDRIDNVKGYIKENVVTCCQVCNFRKSDNHINEFLNWIERVYNHINKH